MTDVETRQPAGAPIDPDAFRSSRIVLLRLVRGRPADARWIRPALLALLAATSCLYMLGLNRSGWANGYYSAAVYSGSKSWIAMLFGSLDPANFISVDKPPAALWPADLLARLFGVNSWTVLLPQAVEGVLAVGLLYATVRRQAGALAALIAGTVLAITPVCTLMFRFNNPDALLTLLFIAAAYATVRALEGERSRWVVLVGVFLGLGFLTKSLQALAIAPALLATYVVCAQLSVRQKLRGIAIAVLGLVGSAGWWCVAVVVTPTDVRPYVGGSQHNGLGDVIFGYNGLGRLTGREAGVSDVVGSSVPGGDRLFRGDMGNQISWLLPAAILVAIAIIWSLRRAQRNDPRLAPILLWGGWLATVGIEISYAKGIIHPYYTIALAPAIAALVAIGASVAWARRREAVVRIAMYVIFLVSALWAVVLFGTSHGWNASLRPAVLALALCGVVLLVRSRGLGRLGVTGVGFLVASCLILPTAWSVKTAITPHQGAEPLAGPPVGSVILHLPTVSRQARERQQADDWPSQMGGLLQISRPNPAMVAALTNHADDFTWLAATVGGNDAAGLELATRGPVMTLGGFNGTDPTPTMAQFQQLVADRKIHFFVAGQIPVGEGVSDVASREIPEWVAAHFAPVMFDAVSAYDLTKPLVPSR